MRIFSKFRGEFTYPDGFGSLIKKAPQQRPQYEGMQSLLEELHSDGLHVLCSELLEPVDKLDVEMPSAAIEKYQNIRAEFPNRPKLLALHGLVIVASRRRNPPEIASTLFQQIWRDHSKVLLEQLDTRWKLSALQTFRDLGENEVQRRCAGELMVFFNMMKLYETERLFGGVPSSEAYDFQRRAPAKLPLNLTPYSIRHGDLDRTLLGMLWLAAEQDPVLEPLACHLLTAINRDRLNIFRRLRLMRRAIKGK